MRILLVGIGYVGSALADMLVSAGQEVFGLRRSDRALPAGVTPLVGDVTRDEGWDRLPAGIEQIVYAVSPARRSEAAYREVYVEGLERVRSRVPDARLLLVSSTAVYGDPTTEQVDERTPLGALDGPSSELARAEHVWPSERSVILRASGIYGPGRTQLLARLLHGDLTREERSATGNRIHRDDLARCLAFFIERPELQGVFNASDTDPAPLGQMADWLAARNVPANLLQHLPSTREPRSRKNRTVSSRKLQEAGFVFCYPTFREGYAAILAALKSPA